MTAILAMLTGPVGRYLAIGAVLLGVAGYGYVLHLRLEAAQATAALAGAGRDAALQANSETQRQLAVWRADQARAAAASTASIAAADRRAARAANTLTEILNVKAVDGVCGERTALVLARLRGAAAGNRDADPGSAPAGAAGPAALRGGS